MSLTHKELRLNIAAYTFISKLNIFPLEISQHSQRSHQKYHRFNNSISISDDATFDSKYQTNNNAAPVVGSIRVTVQSRKWKWCITCGWVLLSCFFSAFHLINLRRLLYCPKLTDEPYYVPISILVNFTQSLALVGRIVGTFQWWDLNVKVLNEIFTAAVKLSADVERRKSQTVSGWSLAAKSISRSKSTMKIDGRKLFLMFLPLVVCSMHGVVIGAYYYDPKLPIFVYSALSERWDLNKMIYLKWACIALDLTLYFDMLAVGYYGEFVVLSLISLLNFKIEILLRSVYKNLYMKRINLKNKFGSRALLVILNKKCQDLRFLQLLINYFNLSFSTNLYLLKLLCINSAVVCGFGGIRFFNQDTLLISLSAFLLFLEVNLLFLFMFDKATEIPDKIQEIRTQVRILSSMLHLKSQRDNMRTKINSLTIKGIYAGMFNVFERESTPNFVDFVLSQIASLLVMDS